jgi:hypothetical protein
VSGFTLARNKNWATARPYQSAGKESAARVFTAPLQQTFCHRFSVEVFMTGIFSTWQPIYAEHGIATFPVVIEGKNKRPMNKGYQRTGLRGSAELAKKFTEASAFGMILGRRNNILLVDVDTEDERALEDTLSTYGDTPVVSRTATGGGFHAWYRYSDEAWKNHREARRASGCIHAAGVPPGQAGAMVNVHGRQWARPGFWMAPPSPSSGPSPPDRDGLHHGSQTGRKGSSGTIQMD